MYKAFLLCAFIVSFVGACFLRLKGYGIFGSLLYLAFFTIVNYFVFVISHVVILSMFNTPLWFQRPLFNKWKYETTKNLEILHPMVEEKVRYYLENELDRVFEEQGIEAILIGDQYIKKCLNDFNAYKASFT